MEITYSHSDVDVQPDSAESRRDVADESLRLSSKWVEWRLAYVYVKLTT